MRKRLEIFLFYWKFIKNEYKKIYFHSFLLFFINVVITALTALLPYLMKLVIDSSSYNFHVDFTNISTLILLLAISFAIAWMSVKILFWVNNIVSALFMASVEAEIIHHSFSSFITSKFEYANKVDIGVLNSDVRRGAVAFGQIIHTIFLVILPVVVQFLIVVSIFALKISLYFSLFFICSMVFISILTFFLISRSGKVFDGIYEADNQQSKFFLEKVSSFYNIKTQGSIDFELNSYRIICNNYIKSIFRGNLKIGILMIYQVVSVGVLLLVSMLFSVNMFNSHQMTSGDFVLISSYIIELSTPLILIAQSLMQTNGHFVSIEKLKKYFENPKDDIDNRNIKLNKFYYVFKEVVFKMNGNYILKDFNFSICEGDFIVINGETGVGKSSFINLLLGINKIQAGQLFFGNIDISKTFSKNIYKELAYVPQKSFIFTGSVRDNMLYNNNITYTDDDIISFLKEFNLYKILINNKIDLDSSIDELFKFFSGGELQRFNIIRALLRKPKILILDEPTSGLDIVMSRKVIDVIKKHISTVIMISHSVDFIDEASQVLNLPIDNS